MAWKSQRFLKNNFMFGSICNRLSSFLFRLGIKAMLWTMAKKASQNSKKAIVYRSYVIYFGQVFDSLLHVTLLLRGMQKVCSDF